MLLAMKHKYNVGVVLQSQHRAVFPANSQRVLASTFRVFSHESDPHLFLSIFTF